MKRNVFWTISWQEAVARQPELFLVSLPVKRRNTFFFSFCVNEKKTKYNLFIFEPENE